MESLSKIDSAGSYDSVISVNSGYVSAAVDLLISVPLTLLLICSLCKPTYRHTLLVHQFPLSSSDLNTTDDSASVFCWNEEEMK